MAKKDLEKPANVAKVTRIFLQAKTPSNKYRNNRKNNKCHKIKDVEREKAKKGTKSPQIISQKVQM